MNTNYENYFYRLVQQNAFPFQISVSENLFEGKNVILQAPTGTGKTWAAILPFIIAKAEKIYFPKKMIYSLPMRVLANSLYDTVSENKFIKELGLKITLQTGEQPNDPYLLEGDIIFTTIDQSLSAILSIPLGLSKRQANINAGALIGSYLIFDEFHLLDSQRSLNTLYHLLKMLSGYSPFCLMSATLSEHLLKELSKEINASIVTVLKEEIASIPSQRNKKRIIETKESYLTAEDITMQHKVRSRSIALCNTVDRCQNIFNNLKTIKKNGNKILEKTEIICIHSRFFGEDRQEKERIVKELFSKESNADAILISTQVIEVGIDITCNVMHSECSPINSLLQRIGRCARFENEEGKVFVYDIEKIYPYVEEMAKVLKDTFEILKEKSGINLDYSSSQDLIDQILTEKEINELKGIEASQRNEDIKRVWTSCDKSEAQNLIRDINSIQVILLPNVDNIVNPYNYQTISVPRYSLISKLNEIENSEWLVREVRESNFIDEFDFENENLKKIKYSFDQIQVEDIKIKTLVILNSNYVKYDKEIGLNFFNGNECSKIKKNKNDLSKNFKITKDTYEEHIDFLIKAYNKYFKGKNEFIHSEFRKKLGIDLSFDDLISFMIVLHDYGKLNVAWQRKAFEYQSKKDILTEGILLAHTDFNDGDERIKFPPHAGVGALVCIALLEKILQKNGLAKDLILQLCRATGSAILRHHSPLTSSSKKYQSVKKAVNITEDLKGKYIKNGFIIDSKIDLLKIFGDFDFTDYIISFFVDEKNIKETLLYFYLVRVLRLCDQKSFEIKEEESNVSR